MILPVAVTGVGIVTPLGNQADEVLRSLEGGRSAVRHREDLAGLPWGGACSVDGPDLGPWLKRKKDRKLLPRAAELALPAAGTALQAWTGPRDDLGLFVGVGREPPDEGESEAALAASVRDGRLEPELLSTEGLSRYPPLLPLKTLPNMILAWLSIILEVRGANGALAGEAGAGMMALAEACHAVAEGRVPGALAGGADSSVSFGAARDLYRLGGAGPNRPPSEAAVFFLLEPLSGAQERGARVLGTLTPARRGLSDAAPFQPHWAQLGDLGTADALVEVALALCRSGPVVVRGDDAAGPTVHILVSPSASS